MFAVLALSLAASNSPSVGQPAQQPTGRRVRVALTLPFEDLPGDRMQTLLTQALRGLHDVEVVKSAEPHEFEWVVSTWCQPSCATATYVLTHIDVRAPITKVGFWLAWSDGFFFARKPQSTPATLTAAAEKRLGVYQDSLVRMFDQYSLSSYREFRSIGIDRLPNVVQDLAASFDGKCVERIRAGWRGTDYLQKGDMRSYYAMNALQNDTSKGWWRGCGP
jgi:hypothetical protein